MRKRSIAIAGCGPCGLAVALLLARNGERVVLFERFDTPRPTGSGLLIQPTGLAILERLGLSERIEREGARVTRLFGKAEGRTVLDVRYGAGPRKTPRFAIGLHRTSLFEALFDAVLAEGVEVRTGSTVTGSSLSDDGRRLIVAESGASEPFDLVVDALGTRSPLVSMSGRELPYGAFWTTLDWPDDLDLPRDTLSQRYRRSSVMAGVLPLGPGRESRDKAAFFWSLKGSDLAGVRQAGLAAWKDGVLALWPTCEPLLAQIDDMEQLTFARYAHRTVRRAVETSMIHLGDAWHSASPQLGQGANMALLDAWALATALSRHVKIDAALDEAMAMRCRHVQLYQWLTYLLTPVYQSDSHVVPFLRDRLVGPLCKVWPIPAIQVAMVAGLVGDPLRKLGLPRR